MADPTPPSGSQEHMDDLYSDDSREDCDVENIQYKERKPKKRRRTDDEEPVGVEQLMGLADPRAPHPGDISQPDDSYFHKETKKPLPMGEYWDLFEVDKHIQKRGDAATKSVLVMKHSKPLPMWLDKYLCPRVMPGKWCGYVGYAFRRRIKFGTWPHWADVPTAVKEEAWEDIMESWDFQTVLNDEELKRLQTLWTAYASNKMRTWRTSVWQRYVVKVTPENDPGSPLHKYKWMTQQEWDLFVQFRSTEKFKSVSEKNSENALKKRFVHHTGAAGYRSVIIDEANILRDEAIQQRIDEGMSLEEAEEEVRNMVFMVDRSIVFLESNRDKHGNYSSDFVKDAADEIIRLNKLKQTGQLIFEGRQDILSMVLGPDPPGRFSGCPDEAKIESGMPEARKRKKAAARREKNLQQRNQEEDGKLREYTEWVADKLGGQLQVDISPEQFLREQAALKKNLKKTPGNQTTAASATAQPNVEPQEMAEARSEGTECEINKTSQNGSVSPKQGTSEKIDSEMDADNPQSFQSQKQPESGAQTESEDATHSDSHVQDFIPCYLQVQNNEGKIVTAAAGLVIPGGGVEPGYEAVQITPPIFLPDEELPIPHEDFSTIANAAGGVPIMWPELFIDYTLKEPLKDCQRKCESKTPFTDLIKAVSVPNCTKDISMPESHGDPLINSPSTQEDLLPTQSKPTPLELKLWKFEHHSREPQARKNVAKWLAALKKSDPKQLCYMIPLKRDVFGPGMGQLHLMLAEALTWISRADRAKKEWLNGWQMDMWCSYVHANMLRNDIGRVQMISGYSAWCNHKKDAVAKKNVMESVRKVITARKARLYVLPICREYHWMLFLLYPEESIIYCIDPQAIGVTQEHKPFLYDLCMSMADMYEKLVRSNEAAGSDAPPKEWTVVNIHHKRQLSTWECGYYVMLYIEKIVLLHGGVDVHMVFPEDDTDYPKALLEGLIDTNCVYMMDIIAPVCNAQNEMRKKCRSYV